MRSFENFCYLMLLTATAAVTVMVSVALRSFNTSSWWVNRSKACTGLSNLHGVRFWSEITWPKITWPKDRII